jgi:hypothetical protein
MLIVTKPSPNQSRRIHGDDAVRLIVCHTPEGSYDSAVRHCLNPAAQVSYHRLYAKNGREATQLVDWDMKAWHAGPMNSLSDGLSVEGFARTFSLSDPGTVQFVKGVAERLVARGLPCQWTTDPVRGGFCRHGDLQSDRTDPTPDLNEWRLFVAMVQEQYDKLTEPSPWPRPIPPWFWTWARWRLGEGEFKQWGPAHPDYRPGPPVPPPGIQWAPGGPYFWAWVRLTALLRERRK